MNKIIEIKPNSQHIIEESIHKIVVSLFYSGRVGRSIYMVFLCYGILQQERWGFLFSLWLFKFVINGLKYLILRFQIGSK
ncbi:MAG: hypothetical protein C0403_05340 [Desulfobacterium sp.]|nr:hypothetical protein [Desulfobacterium sp.]